MLSMRVLVFVAVSGLAPLAFGETWQTTSGDRHEGKLSGVYGGLAVVADKKGSTLLSIDLLDDAGIARVADYLAAQPAQPAAWSASTSKIAKALKGRLHVLRGEKFVDFDPAGRKEPEFYLAYFGAEWCPPCRAFSPRLVKAYQALQQAAPGKFEVIFVSSDRDSSEQLRYVRHVNMPWPVLRFSQIGRADILERWSGRGIPCLVALTREGELLLHSYRGEEYVGPDDVLERFRGVLQASDPNAPGAKRLLHRLAVAQHVKAAGTGTRPAAPYLVSMDLRRYQTLEIKSIMANIEIDERGTVADVTFEPELPAVLNHQLTQDAGQWLFLPMVENGIARRKKAQLPLEITR